MAGAEVKDLKDKHERKKKKKKKQAKASALEPGRQPDREGDEGAGEW